MLDASRGWAVGASTLFRTVDGVHWTAAGEPAGPAVQLIQFLTATHGWGVTAADTLVETGDGGMTWVARPLPVEAESVCFADAQTGWAAGGVTVWRTGDGGATWASSMTAPAPGLGGYDAVQCRGQQAVASFVFGVHGGVIDGAVYRTLDGGASWHVLAGGVRQPSGTTMQDVGQPFGISPDGSVILGRQCQSCGNGSVAVTRATTNGPLTTRDVVAAATSDTTEPSLAAVALDGTSTIWVAVNLAPANSSATQAQALWSSGDEGGSWTQIWRGSA